MLKNAITYVEISSIYANFCIWGIIFAYAILKIPLYAEKYAICGFWQNIRLFTYSHITNIPSFIKLHSAERLFIILQMLVTMSTLYTVSQKNHPPYF